MLGAHVGLIDEHEAAGVIDQRYPRVWQLLAEPLGHRGAVVQRLVARVHREYRDITRRQPLTSHFMGRGSER